MEWVEASGKSLSEAKETVLDLLGVAEDDAEFVILSEPKPGLFGRLRGEARVQARVRPVAPPPKRGRRTRSDRKRSGPPAGERARASGDSSRAGRREVESGAQGGTNASGAPAERAERGAEGETRSGASRSGRRRRSRGRSRNGGPQGGQSPRAGDGQPGHGTSEGEGRRTVDESEGAMEHSLSLEEQGEKAREFLSGLLREFGLEATVAVSKIDDETVQVAATGGDLGLLIGPRGNTLAAVQDLTRTYVQRQTETRTDRIIVDVGGYREKRAAALKRFTLSIVEEVKASGEERALEPMSPADRKVVHDTVTEIDGVVTRSDGLEPDRYVVIQPVAS